MNQRNKAVAYKVRTAIYLFTILAFSLAVFYSCKRENKAGIKIMSYNIKHGVGMDNIMDLSRSAEVIKAQAPDLCALQEIDNYCRRSDSIGQTEYLALEMGMIGTFGKFMDYQGGEYGMASLSSKPLVSSKVFQLPDGIHEPRSSIIQEVLIAPACTIVFVNVHFDWIGGDEGVSSRLDQAKALVHHLNTINKTIIITGDFNCTPGSPTMQFFFDNGFEFADKGEDNTSFQGASQSEIDHLIYRTANNNRIIIRSIELLDEPVVSDHRPLVTELDVFFK